MRKLFLIAAFFCLIPGISLAGRYVRYNYAGYEPQRNKVLLVIADDDCADFKWQIKDGKGAVVLEGLVGKSIAGTGAHTPKPFNHPVDFTALNKPGTYTFEIEKVDTFQLKISEQPYASSVDAVLRYLRVQRCGSDHALDHKACHLGDKSCVIHRRNGTNNKDWAEDEKAKAVNMSGGWHDAGDYIKFTLTTSYTTYFLLRSYETNPTLFTKKQYSKTDLADLLDEAKWGLDYLMKCMPDTTEFIIQAGGWLDHDKGNRLPENDVLDGERECYSALSPTQMGYTAAALALGAKIFKSIGKEKEAATYGQMAKKIYRIARANDKEENNAWFERDFEFYKDETKNDNMELASIELYLLTNEKHYLDKANLYAQYARLAYWASWGSCNMIAHLRVYPYNNAVKNYVEEDMNGFEQIAKQTNNVWGVPHKYTWATLYSFFFVANTSMLYEQATKDKKYEQISLDVLDYTFGRNNWGVSMIANKEVPQSIKNVYSQVYKLQPTLHPTGSIAEGPGDKATHDGLMMRYFNIQPKDPNHPFNTSEVVFFDNATDFQCMETTITGLADGLFMLTLASKK